MEKEKLLEVKGLRISATNDDGVEIRSSKGLISISIKVKWWP